MTNERQITQTDDIDACEGDQMLGIFMHKLYAWAGSTNAGLTKIQDACWIGCSTSRWITERKPWGKKREVSKHQFERMLSRGRKMGVLETCQWPSRFENWKTVLHVRPADGYDSRRTGAAQCRIDGGPMRGFCGTNAGPVQSPDQDHGTISRTGSEAVIGVPADADNAATPRACAPADEHEAIASSGGSSPLPQFRRPPSRGEVRPMQLWAVWADACARYHGLKLERATGKQKGQLGALLNLVQGRGLDSVAFVATVVADWAWLTRRVREKTADALYIPNEPCLGFTIRFLDHLLLVVKEEATRKVREAAHDAEREAERKKEEARNAAARAAHERAERAKLDAMAKQGAQFATKEAAIAAMYACISGGSAPQFITGESIRAFLSSWGGDEHLDDKTVSEKYQRSLVEGYFAGSGL